MRNPYYLYEFELRRIGRQKNVNEWLQTLLIEIGIIEMSLKQAEFERFREGLIEEGFKLINVRRKKEETWSRVP